MACASASVRFDNSRSSSETFPNASDSIAENLPGVGDRVIDIDGPAYLDRFLSRPDEAREIGRGQPSDAVFDLGIHREIGEHGQRVAPQFFESYTGIIT